MDTAHIYLCHAGKTRTMYITAASDHILQLQQMYASNHTKFMVGIALIVATAHT